MKHITSISAHDKQIAQYLVEQNKLAISGISPDCVAPLVAIRKAVQETCKQIGVTLLKSENKLTQEQYLTMTRWIHDVYIKQM